MYIGKSGQLISQLGHPMHSIQFNWLADHFHFNVAPNITWVEYDLDFRIGMVEVLRRRPDGKVPCNGSLSDEDSQWRNSIMKAVGCVPAYWKRFVSNESLNEIPQDCSQEQYLKIDVEYSPISSFNNASKLYVNPCAQMATTVTTAIHQVLYKNTTKRYYLELKFLYSTEYYKQIVNNKAYTGETLLGQVGGFVGKQQ